MWYIKGHNYMWYEFMDDGTFLTSSKVMKKIAMRDIEEQKISVEGYSRA